MIILYHVFDISLRCVYPFYFFCIGLYWEVLVYVGLAFVDIFCVGVFVLEIVDCMVGYVLGGGGGDYAEVFRLKNICYACFTCCYTHFSHIEAFESGDAEAFVCAA